MADHAGNAWMQVTHLGTETVSLVCSWVFSFKEVPSTAIVRGCMGVGSLSACEADTASVFTAEVTPCRVIEV